ncbi:MAG: FtsX-like permease family protein [Pseudomonadota bacterium]
MDIVLRLAWRNLWRQPRRTWLTVAAMVFSNCLLVFMISLQFAIYDLMINNTLRAFSGHLQVQAPGYLDDARMRQVVDNAIPLADSLRQSLPDADIGARATAFVLASSEDRSYGIAMYGVEPAFEPGISSIPGLVNEGRYVDAGDEVVVGRVLARNLRVDLGDELTILGSGRDGSFSASVLTVVGIFDSGVPDLDRSIAEMPLDTFQDVFFMRDAGHHIVVNAPTLADVDAMSARVQPLLPDGLVLPDWDALQPGLQQMIRADMTSAFFTYGILVVLVAFSVLNTQLMSVLERTREFGVVMSLGLSPGRLGRLVLLETLMMGLIGLALGALAGAVLTGWVGTVGFTMPGMDEMAARFNLPARLYPDFTLATLFAGPLVVLLFTLLSAVYPALRLRVLHPVEAMRSA